MKIIPRGFEHLPALKNLNYVSFGTGGGDPKWEYFHIINEYAGDNVLTINLTAQVFTSCSLEYSFNKKTWEALNFGSTTYLTMPEGSTVYLRGTDWQHKRNNDYNKVVFKCNHDFSIGGCIMSLIDYINMKGMGVLKSNAFANLFANNPLISINCNFGDVMVIEEYSLENMFNYCTKLTVMPDLYFNYGDGGYDGMFFGCKSLQKTGVMNIPYNRNLEIQNMFNGCTSLKEATFTSDVAPSIRQSMFYNCPADMVIYVPDISLENYKTTYPWNNRADYIKPISEKPA